MLAMAGYYSGRDSPEHQSANGKRVCVKPIEFALAYWEGCGDGEVTVQ
jgi:hypothetical protein